MVYQHAPQSLFAIRGVLTQTSPLAPCTKKGRRLPLGNSATDFGYCYFPAVAAAGSRPDFDARCVGQRCRNDPRLDDRHWTIRLYAAEPDGLGWADPDLSVDVDY